MARRTALVTKDEGLVFSFLKCLGLHEAKRLWNVQRLFYKVLDGKVIPLLALYERDWSIVGYYMDFPTEGALEGYSRFEYNYDSIAVEAILHMDFEGLRLLTSRKYDFSSVRGNSRVARCAREALQSGCVEQLFTLRCIGFEYSEILAECIASGELSQRLLVNRALSLDFFGARLVYSSSVLDFASTDFVENHLSHLCANRERLFRVPFIMAAFMRAGASPCVFLHPERCGYLLLLAFASESFNFVYLLVKDAVHLEAVFERYRQELLLMIAKSLSNRRFHVLELISFSGFRLQAEDSAQQQFDAIVLKSLQKEDFFPIMCISRLGFSLLGFAERNHESFHAFVQSRLETPSSECGAAAVATPEMHGRVPAPSGVHLTIRRLMKLDRRSLELHFRSRTFLDFAGTHLGRKSFVVLRQIVDVHPQAMLPYFAENYELLESLLINAFHTRDVAHIVDMASLGFPMGRFLARHQAEIDGVLLGVWLHNKCWTELSMLRNEVKQCSFPALFARNQEQSDEFVFKTIQNGYWYDLHNLSSLTFDFSSFFHRRFAAVSQVVLGFIAAPHPHFVLLRELSALNFPWGRFMEVHHDKLTPIKDHDFLKFVISLDGFELGSKVYDVVEQTCRLYHSMAASMFNARAIASMPMMANENISRLQNVSSDVSIADEVASVSTAPLATKLNEAEASFSSSSSSDSRGSVEQLASAAMSSPASATSPILRIFASSSSRAASSASPASASSHARCAPSAKEVRRGACSEAQRDSFRQSLADLVRKAQRKQLDTKKVVMLMICKGAYCWSPLKLNADDVPVLPSSAPPVSPLAPGSGAAFSSADVRELRERVWLDVDGVRNFIESVEDVWLPLYAHFPANLHAAPGGAAAVAAGLAMLGAGPGAAPPPVPLPPPPANAWPWAVPPAAALPAGAAANGIPAVVAAHGIPAAVAAMGGFALPPMPAPAAPGGLAGNSTPPQVAFHMACLAQPGEQRFFSPNVDLFWDDILAKILPLEA